MPTGTVKDDGDPGAMTGRRIGFLEEIENQKPINWLPFSNGRIGSTGYFKKDENVIYQKIDTQKRAYAIVFRRASKI